MSVFKETNLLLHAVENGDIAGKSDALDPDGVVQRPEKGCPATAYANELWNVVSVLGFDSRLPFSALGPMTWIRERIRDMSCGGRLPQLFEISDG